MLHKINQPECIRHLEWIVSFQGDLLRALCDSTVTADDITVEWVKAQRPDINDNWLERFCNWSKDLKSIIERMKKVAKLLDDDKRILIAHYEKNLRYKEAFDNTLPPPPATISCSRELSKKAASAYRDYFDMFYAPILYKGYPINDGVNFTRNDYVKACQIANPELEVCPLCDGEKNGAELDHWLAKKHFPELNCHPQNLVEICSECNSSSNKGEKLALDKSETEPFNNWFHPFLRPAAGHFEIIIERGIITLISNDPVIQTRLNKLDGLINLSERWGKEYRTQFTGILQRIRGHRRRGDVYDNEELRKQIESWKIDAEAEIKIRSHRLIEERVLHYALEPDSDSFKELLVCATDN